MLMYLQVTALSSAPNASQLEIRAACRSVRTDVGVWPLILLTFTNLCEHSLRRYKAP